MLYGMFVLHIVGFAGALVARRLKVPAGALIGSMLAVVLCTITTGFGELYPGNLRIVIQIVSGLVIGSRFTRSDIAMFRRVGLPALVFVVMLLLLNVVFAAWMAHASSLSLVTSFFACAPGGVSDLALVAADFGADMENVSLLQMFRFMFVISFFPPLVKRLFAKKVPIRPAVPLDASGRRGAAVSVRPAYTGFATTVVLAVGGGVLFDMAGIPAGALIGAMVAVAAFNMATSRAWYPGWLRFAIQLFAGTYIGAKVSLDSIVSLPALLVPMAILLLELFVMAFLTAWVLHLVFHIDFATALFASIPGGIAEMGLVSEEMGLDTPRIVFLHSCRVFAVMVMLPIAARLLSLFG